MNWYIYILRCADNSLYTGVTTDVSRRVEEHTRGLVGAKYTRAKRPVTLVYAEATDTRSHALIRESAIKKLPKTEKERLIATSPARAPGNT
jgi:putative endonuclease